MVWITILGLGLILVYFGSGVEIFKVFDYVLTPIEIIKFAQIANGILLPVIAIFLLWVVNRASVMGSYKNTLFQNLIGFTIIALSILLGVKSILKVFGLFG